MKTLIEFWRTRTTRQRMIYYLIAAPFAACGLLVTGACRVWPIGGPFLGVYISPLTAHSSCI